jgi:hypothetical protein
MISFRYLQKVLQGKVKLTKIDEDNLSLIVYMLTFMSIIEGIFEGLCFAVLITQLAEVIGNVLG